MTVSHRCRTNCSDRVKDDKLFKVTLIQYMAYFLKSGYSEKKINKKFINFAIRNK